MQSYFYVYLNISVFLAGIVLHQFNWGRLAYLQKSIMKYSLQKFIPALSARLKKKKKLKAIISQKWCRAGKSHCKYLILLVTVNRRMCFLVIV